jgi:hypothetical protein
MTVSLLDIPIRFDYPERALAGHSLVKNEIPALRTIPAVGNVNQRCEPEIPAYESPGKPPFLGIIVCTSAATNVAFVTNEVTW